MMRGERWTLATETDSEKRMFFLIFRPFVWVVTLAAAVCEMGARMVRRLVQFSLTR